MICFDTPTAEELQTRCEYLNPNKVLIYLLDDANMTKT